MKIKIFSPWSSEPIPGGQFSESWVKWDGSLVNPLQLATVELPNAVVALWAMSFAVHNPVVPAYEELTVTQLASFVTGLYRWQFAPVADIFALSALITDPIGTVRFVISTATEFRWTGTFRQQIGEDNQALTNNLGFRDASTNTPILLDSIWNAGDFYTVSVGGNYPLDSVTEWAIWDYVRFDASTSERKKIDNQSPIQTQYINVTTNASSPLNWNFLFCTNIVANTIVTLPLANIKRKIVVKKFNPSIFSVIVNSQWGNLIDWDTQAIISFENTVATFESNWAGRIFIS